MGKGQRQRLAAGSTQCSATTIRGVRQPHPQTAVVPRPFPTPLPGGSPYAGPDPLPGQHGCRERPHAPRQQEEGEAGLRGAHTPQFSKVRAGGSSAANRTGPRRPFGIPWPQRLTPGRSPALATTTDGGTEEEQTNLPGIPYPPAGAAARFHSSPSPPPRSRCSPPPPSHPTVAAWDMAASQAGGGAACPTQRPAPPASETGLCERLASVNPGAPPDGQERRNRRVPRNPSAPLGLIVALGLPARDSAVLWVPLGAPSCGEQR